MTSITNPGASYDYDNNGNMLTRGDQSISWDVENRPVSVSVDATEIAGFVYDGDGNRIMKAEGGHTILYVNKYFEVNLSTSTNTSYYYLVGRLVAMMENTTTRFIHQDHEVLALVQHPLRLAELEYRRDDDLARVLAQ